jgi:hypothetical protein
MPNTISVPASHGADTVSDRPLATTRPWIVCGPSRAQWFKLAAAGRTRFARECGGRSTSSRSCQFGSRLEHRIVASGSGGSARSKRILAKRPANGEEVLRGRI